MLPRFILFRLRALYYRLQPTRFVKVFGKNILVMRGVFNPGRFEYGKFFLNNIEIKKGKKNN